MDAGGINPVQSRQERPALLDDILQETLLRCILL